MGLLALHHSLFFFFIGYISSFLEFPRQGISLGSLRILCMEGGDVLGVYMWEISDGLECADRAVEQGVVLTGAVINIFPYPLTHAQII